MKQLYHYGIGPLQREEGRYFTKYSLKDEDDFFKFVPHQVLSLIINKKSMPRDIGHRNRFPLDEEFLNIEKHLMNALNSGLISIGVHSGTAYWDCSEDFIVIIQKCFNAYSNGCISLDVPFLKWNKRLIWEMSNEILE